jgi:uncharacterized protein YbjT (DUF2867 family)
VAEIYGASTMKVFVTGATGFVGRQILGELCSEGHSVRILVRQPYSPCVRELVHLYNAEIHSGDVLEPSSFQGSLAAVDAVVHLVGIISEVGTNTFENVHIGGTQNIVAAAQKSRVSRFLHMSALGARPEANSRYHQSKWAGEEIVRRSGLSYTIFRPSIIYGPEDKFVNTFVELSRFSPLLPVLGRGTGQLQPIAVQSVATAFVKSLIEPESAAQTYDLCGLERLTFNQVLEEILVVTGRSRFKLHLPFWIAWQVAKIIEYLFPRFLRLAPPFNRDQLVMLQEDNVGDPEPAKRLFGLEQISFRAGISRYLQRQPSPRNERRNSHD